MRSSSLSMSALLLVGALGALPASAATYGDAAADFSLSANPNGNWTYGATQTIGGTLTPFVNKGTGALDPFGGAVGYWLTGSPTWTSMPAVFENTSTSAVTVAEGLSLPAGALVLHPSNGGAQAVARFTAPSAGTYAINATFTTLDQQAKNTQAAVLVAGAVKLKQTLSKVGATATWSGLATLKQGDTVDFAADNGGDGFNDDSVRLVATVAPTQFFVKAKPTAADAQTWQDSGFDVPAGTLNISAKGTATYTQNTSVAAATPDGLPSNRSGTSSLLAPALPAFALVGKIGQSGTPFLVGSKYSGVVPAGHLYLGFNDTNARDNAGGFDTSVSW